MPPDRNIVKYAANICTFSAFIAFIFFNSDVGIPYTYTFSPALPSIDAPSPLRFNGPYLAKDLVFCPIGTSPVSCRGLTGNLCGTPRRISIGEHVASSYSHVWNLGVSPP